MTSARITFRNLKQNNKIKSRTLRSISHELRDSTVEPRYFELSWFEVPTIWIYPYVFSHLPSAISNSVISNSPPFSNLSLIELIKNSTWGLSSNRDSLTLPGGGGGVLPEKFGRGVRPASQNRYPIYDQNLRFSLLYLWPDQKFDTLFMTWLLDH